MDLQLVITVAALAVGLWYLLAPHATHMKLSPDWTILNLNLPHEVHMALGGAIAVLALWHLNKRFKLIKL